MRDLIIGGQLAAFDGKNVSITGRAFSINVADDVIVSVILSNKLDKPIDGYVEVHGTVKGKSVYAEECIWFKYKEFVAANHVKMCLYLQNVPNLWSNK